MKLPINRFIGKVLSYMYKTLFIIMENVYKACNPTTLNLSIVTR